LALGAVLLSGADALLLDEPTNHLDVDMRDWLAGYLNNFGGAQVLVSHDRNFLDRVVRKVAWLRNGSLKLYEGNYSAFRKERQQQEDIEARQYANWVKEKERREAILEQSRRWAPSSEVHAKRMHSLEARMEQFMQEAPDAPQYDEAAVRMRFPQGVALGDTRRASNLADAGPERVLEGEALSKSLAGRKLFEIKTMLIRRGERIALIGPNGAGKTTLLKVLLGQLSSDNPAGRVKTGYGIHVGYYDQQLSGFDPEVTLYQTLYRLLGEKAHAALGAWKFPYEAQFKKIANLSGGERARMALLSLSLKEANLLILDEPTNHLDLETVEALEEALLMFPGTLLLVSHDLFFLNQLATRTWHVRGGAFEDYPGPPSEYFERTGNAFASLVPRPLSPAPSPDSEPQHQKATPNRIKGKWHLERERDRLEAQVAELEGQIQTTQARINAPGLGPDDYRSIADEQHRLEQELSQTYAAWESVVQKLEA
jgi:ATP-binding cassette subfamily F protein 3